jgi:hypothetical protein
MAFTIAHFYSVFWLFPFCCQLILIYEGSCVLGSEIGLTHFFVSLKLLLYYEFEMEIDKPLKKFFKWIFSA